MIYVGRVRLGRSWLQIRFGRLVLLGCLMAVGLLTWRLDRFRTTLMAHEVDKKVLTVKKAPMAKPQQPQV